MQKLLLPLASSMLIMIISGCASNPDLPPGGTPMPPTTGLEPQPGDDKLKRDKVFLDFESSSLVVEGTTQRNARVVLNGNLSDPCHMLRVVVSPLNSQREISLDVYSVFDPGVRCIMVLRPFNAAIPLGSFSGGHFTVFANGQLLGEFDS